MNIKLFLVVKPSPLIMNVFITYCKPNHLFAIKKRIPGFNNNSIHQTFCGKFKLPFGDCMYSKTNLAGIFVDLILSNPSRFVFLCYYDYIPNKIL